MAALHSYELNGKKLSFANWISNLSPTETPFCSMTGKEAVNQTKFFWQTDRLAKAGAHSVLEGSDAGEADMRTTTLQSNVTQILRRSFSVSDTANTLASYGRGRELSYQMEKFSIALRRDLENHFLTHETGTDGNGTTARQTSGIQGLVSKAQDPDTGATVWHNATTGGTFALADLRKMTFNLYLANSEADVIMFHPLHAQFFAGLQTVGANVKMIDGDESTFSHYVATYVDEFGKTYKLVPNKFMPKDYIYFIKPTDFTQMVLRAPQKVQLGREGNFEQWMIEMEVGLRLRDPWAAGVLKI